MQRKFMKKSKKGFTLIELLVVIAVIALLLAVIMPALNKAKIAASKVVCGNHLKQIGLSLVMYADQNDDSFGKIGSGARLWDITYSMTDFIMDNGGDRRTFYCPLNRWIRADLNGYWRFEEANGESGVLRTPPDPDIPDGALDRDPAPIEAQRPYYRRVTNLFWLFGRETTLPVKTFPAFEFTQKLTRVTNTAAKELVTDATVSSSIDLRSAACSFSQWKSSLYGDAGYNDSSNHVGRDDTAEDANILFVDGHVDRRRLERMLPWFGNATGLNQGGKPYHWW